MTTKTLMPPPMDTQRCGGACPAPRTGRRHQQARTACGRCQYPHSAQDRISSLAGGTESSRRAQPRRQTV